ncbi:hypothetical protein EVG20_g5705, partial [Dentipellis fragilis]
QASPPLYKKGDKVWLESKHLRVLRPTVKFSDRRYGPFKITQVMGPVTFKLQLPGQWKIHPVFHASLLTPYRQTEAHGPTKAPPPPDLIEGEDYYEVEEVLDSKLYRGRIQYLVRWKGYTSSEDTWEYATSLADSAQEAIDEFHEAHPEAINPTSPPTTKNRRRGRRL